VRLGFLTDYSEERVAFASDWDYDCLSVQFASLKAATGGDRIDDAAVDRVRETLAQAEVDISGICLYGRRITDPPDEVLADFRHAMDLAERLNVSVIPSVPGADPEVDLEANMPAFKKVFEPIARMAEDRGMYVAFENWPAVRGYPVKIGSVAAHPRGWEMMFEAVESDALGLEFDPSHLEWQGIDPVLTAAEWSEKIFHFHAKDTEMFDDRLATYGIYESGWWRYRIPGFGVVDWVGLFNVLREAGYEGGVVVEHEDIVFSGERFDEGLEHAVRFLAPLVR
jgi:sugar phosphate isomerase/epimerase